MANLFKAWLFSVLQTVNIEFARQAATGDGFQSPMEYKSIMSR
jgi:hypothetical protein